MNKGQPTPVGQSAVSAGQSVPAPKPDGDGPVTQSGAPVPGPTPVGETAHSAPPTRIDPAAQAAQRRQNVGNLSILARQAISMGHETMTVDPRIVADFCAAYDQMAANTGSVAPPDGALEAAEEKGRREAAASFAEERAGLLQRNADLSLTLSEITGEPETEPTADTAPSEVEFKGPGQQ